MTTIGASGSTAIFESFRAAAAKAKTCGSLQVAAQAATDVIFETFAESIVLCRIFAVVPFEKLPAEDQRFVRNLGAAKGLSKDIRADTQVLSLLGSRGVRPAWNDRKGSVGHLGIPLVSATFIRAIPMLSRMLFELGVDVGIDDPKDKSMVARLLAAGLGGVFHVPDAAKTTDQAGRKIIPAQDFVTDCGVKSVFGVAGNYMTGLSIAVLMFTRDDVSREEAKHFLALVNQFKASTMPLASAGQIYK